MNAQFETHRMRLIVFSAVGSLPLHLAAVLVFAGGRDGLPPAAAGLVSSAILTGLFAACLSQALGYAQRLFNIRLTPLVALQTALLLVLPTLWLVPALLAWFVVGWISGIFMYRGMLAAAAAREKYLGFLARLVAVMALAGVIALGVGALGGADPYRAACAIYAAIVCITYAAFFPANDRFAAAPQRTAARPVLRGATLRALAPLVLFFVGALMIGSHLSVFVTLSDASANSMTVFGLAKLIGAVVLLGTLLVWRHDSLVRLFISGAALVVSSLLLAGSPMMPILAAIVSFEVMLNIAGAAFMGEVARDSTQDVQRFIPAAGLAGIAIGPSLASTVAALSTPVNMLFMAVAAIALSMVLHLALRSRQADRAAVRFGAAKTAPQR